MENAFGKIISILLLVVLIYIVPLKYYMDKNQALEEMYVSTKTIELVDSVRNTGFVTKEMYDQYLSLIHNMNNLYKIKLEHIIYLKSEEKGFREKQYVTDIENDLYSNGIYNFKIDDYFKIQVRKTSNNELVSYYGGYIKNESY